MKLRSLPAFVFTSACLLAASPAVRAAQTVFVEAESFDSHGGWSLDTSFTHVVGSPYLLAHGLGKPVKDATGKVQISEAGEYRVWVRTKDWVGPWKAPGTPGRFQLVINGTPLAKEFGTVGGGLALAGGRCGEIEEGRADAGPPRPHRFRRAL